MRCSRVWMVGCLAWAFGCAARGPLPLDSGMDVLDQREGLTVQWTGVGAFWLHHDGVAVLTDPFWSNYSLGRVLVGTLPSDPAQIDPWLPPLDEVQAVLVGHGHYDHVSDLPYVAPRLHPNAVVLASQTVGHTFAAVDLGRPIVPVNDARASATHPGRWFSVADGRARVLPIQSGHPAQYGPIHLYTRRLTQDRQKPPTRVGHFQEGETLAFLVDFMDETDAIVHRVYIETSSVGLPAGAVPDAVLSEHPVDVALVAMDIANLEARGEETILDVLGAPTVIFCHWDDFFRPKDRPPREIHKVDLRRLREQLPDREARRYIFPEWGARYVFPSERVDK